MNNTFDKNIDEKVLNATELRLLFHKYLYNNSNIIEELIQIIGSYIDSLSIEYSPENKSISIKIKKTTMKKNSNFIHNTDYYYPLFNNIMYHFFCHHTEIMNIAKDNNYDMPSFDQYLSLIPGSYNITCVSDNIIIMYL